MPLLTTHTTKHRYERVISNILSYKASRAKTNADASFNQVYSAPFVIGEFIAIRDEPTGPFYVALVQRATAKVIRVHYHGTANVVLANAVFKPCWNHKDGEDIILSQDERRAYTQHHAATAICALHRRDRPDRHSHGIGSP
jgi:hypothetical protein